MSLRRWQTLFFASTLKSVQQYIPNQPFIFMPALGGEGRKYPPFCLFLESAPSGAKVSNYVFSTKWVFFYSKTVRHQFKTKHTLLVEYGTKCHLCACRDSNLGRTVLSSTGLSQPFTVNNGCPGPFLELLLRRTVFFHEAFCDIDKSLGRLLPASRCVYTVCPRSPGHTKEPPQDHLT
jgi:hypothetical protein